MAFVELAACVVSIAAALAIIPFAVLLAVAAVCRFGWKD